MSTASTTQILEQAEQRARADGVPYRGNVTPQEAWALLQSGEATLVDVRTAFEVEWIGCVPGGIPIEWKRLPGMVPNMGFLDALKATVPNSARVLFLCRSGGRSGAAAALAAGAGYHNAFNILGGFEGDLDGNKQRNQINGWRKAGLPWSQT